MAFDVFEEAHIMVVYIIYRCTHCGQADIFEQVHGGRRWSVRQRKYCRRQQ